MSRAFVSENHEEIPRNSAPAGQIRIIGGQWRGRKLPVPDSPGLRPTTDRVRETLFNWLAPEIHGTRAAWIALPAAAR